jgi:Ca2+-binding RTX toxin-like protein
MALYAALSEQVYRRDETNDQGIKLTDIRAGLTPLQNIPVQGFGLNLTQDASGYIYSTGGGTSGFCAMVTLVDNKYVVTFRGVDSTLSAWETVYANAIAANPPPPQNPATLTGNVVDTGDGYTSRNVGAGTTNVTQWDAAKALVEYVVETLAGGNENNVVVTGQSMGGGLAALASLYFGVEGNVFAPAPFKAQLDIEAMRDAVEPTIEAHRNKFEPTFLALSIDQQMLALSQMPKDQFIAAHLASGFDNELSYNAIMATFQQSRAANNSDFTSNLTRLHVETVQGESLTANNTLLGTFIQIGATQIKAPEKSFVIGDASDEGKHSPALHSLLVMTDGPGNKFETLLRNDQILRYSIVGEPNGLSSPVMNNVSAPVDHGRLGPANDASKLISTGPNSYLLEDVLWKSVADDGALYNYFYNFFGTTAATGAAGTGMGRDTSTRGSIHDGVVRLALQVLRDAIQDTNNLSQVKAKLGDTWNFAGGPSSGTPFSDKVVIRLDQIAAALPGQLEQLNGGPAQKFGVREINGAVANAVFEDLSHSKGGVSAGVINLILGSAAGGFSSGQAALAPWKVLVVQGGGDDALAYDAKQTGVSGDATSSHVIIGGKGADNLKGSSVKDFILGGEGNDTIEGGGGNDVIAGGSGDDRYIARPGPTAADSVYFLGGDGKDTAVYGTDFNSTSLKLSAAVLLASNPATAALVTVGSGGRADTLIGIERIEFGKADDVAKFSDIGQKLGITLSVSLGSNQVDRIKETEVVPSGATFSKGAFTTLEFSTQGATGPQQQTLNTAADFDAKERANTIIMVNGHQLVGGATFDLNKFDLISSGNVKPIWLSPPRSFPVVATDDQVQRWLDEQIDIANKFFAGISGNVPGVGTVSMGPLLGFAFAPILYGELAHFKESWDSGYSQSIIGLYGENYSLGALNGDGSRTLTITLNAHTDGANQTIVINNWMPGDYGIQIKSLGFMNGLDSGTNKNGILEGWQDVSLDTIRARLAEVGFTPSGPATPGSGDGSGGSSGASAFAAGAMQTMDAADAPAPLVRIGNASDNDIAGGLGDDLLRGYAGNDDLLGDDGRDVYVFAAGDGHDVVEDLSAGGNIIRFLDGLDVASITKQLVADDDGNQDLLITYGSGDTILIKDWSLLSTAEQDLWTFESVSGTFTPASSANEPDLSVEPDVVGGVVPTFVTGTSGNDVINGADFDEQIDALAGNDAVNAGGGNDIVFAGDGNDTVEGGAGNDRIDGGDGANLLSGGDGNDTITAGNGVDEIRGGKGNDRLEGGTNNDLYVFGRGDGQDEIYDRNGGTLFFSPPDTNNTLRLEGINPGEITIERNPRDPLGLATDPDQSFDITLHVAGTSDSIRLVNQYGTSGFLAIAYDGIDFVVFDNGVQWTRADLEARYLQQAATSGDDHIFAFYGNDRLEGKAGNDTLEGNYGSDSYIWNRGDGNDHIRDNEFNAQTDTDRLVLGSGISASDITFVRTVDQSGTPSSDLLIMVGGANGGTLTIEDYFWHTYDGIEKIAFADGTVWNRADIDQHYLAAYLSTGNDVVYGTSAADSIDGGSGNDTLHGGAGTDTLDGGAGNDRLIGSDSGQNDFDVYRFDANFGQDTVFDNGPGFGDPVPPFPDGGVGQDRIEFTAYNLADFTFTRTGSGNTDLLIARTGATDQVTIEHFTQYVGLIESFKFADGTVLSWTQIGEIADRSAATTNALNGSASAETLTGTAGADRIAALAGNDTINAGDGNDVVNGGDGDDVINGESGSDIILGGAGLDTIDAGDGDDVVYAGSGNDTVTGGNGADRLTGESGDDRLDGGAGDDSLSGGAGNDLLIGGAGNDLLVGGAGNDTYQFGRGDGQDVIQAATDRAAGATRTLTLTGGITVGELQYAFSGRDLILTFAGTPADRITVADFLGAGSLTSIVIGATTLTTTQILETMTGATSGADAAGPIAIGSSASVVYGGRGNDTLTGDATDNTFVFVKGDGQDRLNNPNGIFDSSTDEVVLKGYAAGETLLARAGTDGGDLAITFTTGTDRIDVTRQLNDPGFNGINAIRFEDGTVWSAEDIKAHVLANAVSAGNDSITGFDDTDDVIGGGAGNDALAGGTGNDRYVFNIGDGQDTISDAGGDRDLDTLAFGAGIRPANVAVTRSTLDPNDAILTLSAADVVTLKGAFADATSGVDQVVFADGTIWTRNDLATAALAARTTTAADSITGTVLGETLSGGLGNDTLSGGGGDDAYVFNRGDGQDTVIELANGGNDRLLLGSGITTAQVSVRKGAVDPTDIVLDAGSGDTVTLKGQLNGTSGVEQIIFADGTAWGRVDIDQKLMAASQTAGADSIAGSTKADTITGGAGNDTIDGRDGADVYVFGRGDGQDTISDSGSGIGQDRIELGANIGAADVDFAHGTNPNDLVIAIRGTTDRITVTNHFAAGGPKIGEIILKDGTALFAADIAALANNHAPTVANAITAQTVAQNGAFNFAVPGNVFADVDPGDDITLTATKSDGSALPGWLHFDGVTFTGTPANGDVGPLTVRLTATDDAGDSVTSDFTINVTNVNDAPVSTALIANKRATVGTAFSFQLAANQFVDPDNGLPGVPTQTITLSAKLGSGAALPSWLTFNASTRTFSGTPASANQGALDIVVTASDGSASSTTRFGIFVGTSGNTTPTVGTAMGTQNATEDTPFTFQIPTNAFADTTAGDRLRYTAALSNGSALPSWLTLDPITGQFSGTPGNADVAQLTVRVTATDIFGASVATNFTLRVNNVNDAPVANGSLSSFVTSQNSAFSYTIPTNFFTDPDTGDGLQLFAALADGSALPTWLLFNPTTRTFSGTPANGDVGMLDIIVGAVDHSNAVAISEMFILVTGVNDPPVVAHPLQAVEVDRQQSFAFTVPAGTFSDDKGAVALTARMIDGSALPSWLSFDPLTRTFVGTPDGASVGDSEGVHLYRVAVVATDSDGAQTSAILNLAVRGPNPPTLIFGTEGNDSIGGTLGPDTIYGLGGDDVMQGKEGVDTYVFDRGFGHDTIAARYINQFGLDTAATDDVIAFGAGIAPSDITVTFADSFGSPSIFFNTSDPTIIDSFFKDDIILTLAGTGDSVRIQRQLDEDRFVNFHHPIEQIRFADGTVWSAADLTAKVATGGSGNDLLAGDAVANVLTGGAGNDRLVAQDGNDTLIGGTGNDDLYGGLGDDVYVFNLGDGKDRILDVSQFSYNANSFDTLRFGAGIRPIDLQFVRDTRDPFSFSSPADAGSLLVTIGGTTDSIKIYWQYAVVNNLSAGIDQFEFADGTVLNRAQIDALVNPGNQIVGTDAAETLTGTAASETIIGKKGADFLQGADGNDTYIWNVGDGNDTIQEFNINSFDVVSFGIGIRPQDFTFSHIGPFGDEAAGYYLYLTYTPTGEKLTVAYEFGTTSSGQPQPTIEEFRFADGTVWTQGTFITYFLASTAGNDIIQGFPNRADTMDGGAGNDELRGGSGADTYMFGRGYGNDTIFDGLDGLFGNIVDRIQFNSTVASTEVTISRVSHMDPNQGRIIDTVLSIAGTTDTLTVAGSNFGFDGDTFTSIAFGADSGFWSGSGLGARYLTQNSTSGNDNVIGFQASETINTGLGNDTLDGGRGNDTLTGGAGNDTYVFYRAPDTKVIRDAGLVGDVDTLQLAPDILAAQVTIVKANNENDLIIKINGGSSDGIIILEGRLIGAQYSADQIRFADNTLWDFTAIMAHAQAAAADAHPVNGTAAAEALNGTSLAETFDSLAGADTITGGAGEDIYIYRTGYGNDIIVEDNNVGETDTLKLRDLTASQIVLLQSGNDLVINISPTGELLTIKNQFNFSGTAYGVEEIVFSDRTVWNRAQINPVGFAGTAAADSLLGGFGSDAFAGLGGNDTIDGAGGTDTVIYGGNWRDYAISYNAGTATYTLGDRRAGAPDGVDQVVNVERFQFADRVIAVSTPTDLLNDAPTDISVTGGVVEENSGAGTLVGTLAAVDPDAGDSAAFVLVSGATDKFDIVGNQIVVKSGAVIDYETATSHQLGIRVTDAGGLTFTKTITITVTDVDESGIIGTAGPDTLTGTSGPDRISGFAGNDTLIGGAGADTLNGGSEFDVASYSNATAGVTANLANAALNTGDAAGDVYNSIEGLIGSGFNDALTGDANANTLAGGAGNDTLDGGAGADTMTGGTGNDLFVVDSASDVVTENLSEGTDEVRTGLSSYTLGGNLENLTFTGTGAFTGTGNTLNNVITGGAGDDTLDGGSGNDTLVGGTGNDVYLVDAATDVVTEAASAGLDEERTALTALTLAANVEILTYTGSAAFAGTGNALDNAITGGIGNDTLDGGAGNDTLTGGAGNDVYLVDATGDVLVEAASAGTDEVRTTLASYTLATNFENLTYTGSAAFAGTGNTAANVITGGAGNDTLDGGSGSDTLIGGLGNDVYIVDVATDVVTEAASAGTDEVRTALASYTLGSNLENLTYTGAATFTGTGNTANNVITGGAGNDTLDGGSGNDTLIGGLGNDVYIIDATTDVVTEAAGAGTDEERTALAALTLAANVEKLTYTGSTAFAGTGNALDNTITGGAGADTLDGGAGNDSLIGGAGNDVYVVDSAGDVVTEAASAGTDEIRTTLAAYTLLANIENLTFTGTGNFSGTGNTSANTLTGGAGNDTLDGGSGSDTLVGGAGNDVYFVDVSTDVITEAASAGTDEVRTTLASFTLGTNLENLTYIGTGAFTGTGNTADNVITGGSSADSLSGGNGNDTLIGGAGNDTLVGGAGNDVYYVDQSGDTVTEAASAGTDEVRTTLASYTLGSNVENLTFVGTGNFSGTGNTLANVLTGGAGNDSLNGGTGSDTMIGGDGNDVYTVDVSTDVITETATGGTDEVRTALTSFTLGTNLENLTYTGTAAFTGTGNTLNNLITGSSGADTLTGGAGDDTLNGGAGNDRLVGGTGNDVYIVDSASDTIVENASEGTDEVRTALTSFTLGSNVENLTFTGTSASTGTGNTLDNFLTGGSGNDTLNGSSGNDFLRGLAGNDSLTGGAGNDSFVFDPSFGKDTITDFTAGTGIGDVIEFHGLFASFAAVQAASTQVGADVQITIDAATSILLKSVALASLVQDDFRFL